MDPKPAASRSVPLTWGSELLPAAPPAAARSRSRDRSRIRDEAASYAIAFGAVAAAVFVTQFTWPFFSRTPLLLLFMATFAAARWANETAALLSILLAAFSTGFGAPGGAGLVDEPTTVLFVAGSLIVNRIVIGRNRAERALRASEAQFRAAWDNSAFGAALLNGRGLVERINPAMERTLGYPSAAWGGVSFGYFSHPDDQADERARFAAFIDGGEEWYHREQRYRRADGGMIWCRATMSATHDGHGGRRTGALMVLEDVTRRRRAEADLRASEARYRRLFDEIPLPLFQCGADGRLLAVNTAFVTLLGHDSVDNVRGTGIAELIADRPARSAIQDALAAGGRLHDLRAEILRNDGGRVAAILDMRPVRAGDGTLEYLDGSARQA